MRYYPPTILRSLHEHQSHLLVPEGKMYRKALLNFLHYYLIRLKKPIRQGLQLSIRQNIYSENFNQSFNTIYKIH